MTVGPSPFTVNAHHVPRCWAVGVSNIIHERYEIYNVMYERVSRCVCIQEKQSKDQTIPHLHSLPSTIQACREHPTSKTYFEI